MKLDYAFWRVSTICLSAALALFFNSCADSGESIGSEALQARLSDPGWEQPMIAPRIETPLPAPSPEHLAESQEVAASAPDHVIHSVRGSSKQAVWCHG